MEAAGIPTVVITTTKFRSLTDKVAISKGLPALRIVEVEHPLGGADRESVERWADAATEETLALLTGSTQ